MGHWEWLITWCLIFGRWSPTEAFLWIRERPSIPPSSHPLMEWILNRSEISDLFAAPPPVWPQLLWTESLFISPDTVCLANLSQDSVSRWKKRETKTEHSTRFAGVMCPKADSQTLQVSMRGNAVRGWENKGCHRGQEGMREWLVMP